MKRVKYLWKKLYYARLIAQSIYTPQILNQEQIKMVNDFSDETVASKYKKNDKFNLNLFDEEKYSNNSSRFVNIKKVIFHIYI